MYSSTWFFLLWKYTNFSVLWRISPSRPHSNRDLDLDLIQDVSTAATFKFDRTWDLEQNSSTTKAGLDNHVQNTGALCLSVDVCSKSKNFYPSKDSACWVLNEINLLEKFTNRLDLWISFQFDFDVNFHITLFFHKYLAFLNLIL